MDVLPPLQGFTPVRRREPDHPLDGAPGGLGQKWTAARCNRLLRPLTSKLEILRRYAEKQRRLAATRAQAAARDPRNRAASQDGNPSAIEQFPESNERSTSHEPEWISKKTGRRGCRVKYSNRATRDSESSGSGGGKGASSTPGRVTVASPILRRVLEATPDSSEALGAANGGRPEGAVAPDLTSATQSRRHPTMTREGKRINLPSSTYLHGFATPDALNVWHSFYTSVETLLRNCSYAANKRRRGARSRFSMCLRRIPQAWNDNELWLPEASAESSNRGLKDLQDGAEVDIYTELETTWSMSEGWHPLHEVVRSHALMLIEHAVTDRTLPFLCMQDLIMLYQRHSLFDEMETLIAATIEIYALSPRPPSIDSSMLCGDTSLGTRALSYVKPPYRRSMQYRQIARLLGCGTLNADWLVTRGFALLWDTAISSLCLEDAECVDAWQFLETALRAPLALQDDELEDRLPVEGSEILSEMEESGEAARPGRDGALPCVGSSPDSTGCPAQPMPMRLSNALDRLVSSLMEGLAAIQILGHAHYGNTYTPRSNRGSRKIASLLSSLTTNIQRKLVLDWGLFTWERIVTHRVCITMHAVLLANLGGRSQLSETCVQSAYETVTTLNCLLAMLTSGMPDAEVAKETTKVMDTLTESFFRIALCCSRATRNGAPEIVKALVDNLVGLADDDLTAAHLPRTERDILSHLIFNAVSRPATDGDDQHQSQWARDLQERFRPMKVTRKHAKTSKQASGGSVDDGGLLNSWEEDLCQRLASTPAISSRRRRDSTGSESSEEEGFSQRRRQFLDDVGAQTRLESPPKLSHMLLGSTPASTKNPATTSFRLQSPQTPSSSKDRKGKPRRKLFLPAKRKKHHHENGYTGNTTEGQQQGPAAGVTAEADDRESASQTAAAAATYSWSPGSPMVGGCQPGKWPIDIDPEVDIDATSLLAVVGARRTPPPPKPIASRAFRVFRPVPPALAAPGVPPPPVPADQQPHPTRLTTSCLHDVSNIDFRPRHLDLLVGKDLQKLNRPKHPLPFRRTRPRAQFQSAATPRGYDGQQDDSEDELCR